MVIWSCVPAVLFDAVISLPTFPIAASALAGKASESANTARNAAAIREPRTSMTFPRPCVSIITEFPLFKPARDGLRNPNGL